MPKLGVTSTEIKPIPSIEGVRTGISAALIETKRGIPNKPRLLNGESSLNDEFGYNISGKYSHPSLKGAFLNGSELVWGSRVVGAGTRGAAGADAQKIPTTQAQHSFGMATHPVVFTATVRGLPGLEYSLEAVANTSNVSALTVTGKEIQLKLASTDDWFKNGNVCYYLLNGNSLLVKGASAVTSIIFYANVAGDTGTAYAVEVIDTGALGVTYAFSVDGLTLTVNLGGSTVTVATAVTAINALAKGIRAKATDAGSGNLAVFAHTHLLGGSSAVMAIGTVACDLASTDAVAAFGRTYLAGTGVVGIAGDKLTTNLTGATSTPIKSKVMYGDKVVILNGVDKGAYEVTGIDETGIHVTNTENLSWTGFTAVQTNLLYTVYGRLAKYDHITLATYSLGTGGDAIYAEITKNRISNELTAVVKCLDEDDTVRVLETFTGLSAVPSSSKYIDSIIASDSRWVSIDTKMYSEIASIAAATTAAGANTITKAGATMRTDGAVVGTICVVTGATTAADIKVVTVTEVVSETVIKVSENFAGSQADVAFVLLNEDATGNELLSYIGTSTITLTMDGGVDVTPTRTDYEGSSSLRTGMYALSLIPRTLYPNKFMAPEAVSVLDSVGADATADLDQALADYALSATGLNGLMIYCRFLEFGLTPNDVIAGIVAENYSNDVLATWWNWGKVSDPISGTSIWCPLVGHMLGIIDGMDSGRLGEGIHQAPANVPILGVLELEYDAKEDDAGVIADVNVNAIINLAGIRPYGDYIQASTPEFNFLHKRLFTIKMVRSVTESLATWLPWAVQSMGTRNRAKLAVDSFSAQFDRRKYKNQALENYTSPSAQPWSTLCNETNNSNGSTVVNIEHGFDIVNTIESVNYRYGFNMSSGAITIEQV
jgi:hypothetical protein